MASRLEHNTEKAMLRLLYAEAGGAIPFHLVSGAVLVSIFHGHADGGRLAIWATALVASVALRLLIVRSALARPEVFEDPARVRGLYAFGAGVAALIWGLGFPYLTAGASPVYQAFYLMFIAGVSSSAIGILSLSRLVYLTFHLSCYLPVLATLFWWGSPLALAMAAMSVSLFVAQPAIARWAHRRLVEAIAVKLENERLALDLATTNRQLEAANAKLQTLAIRDGLTQLYNRRHFDESLINEIRRARRNGDSLSVILFDLDHFKEFNDRHGHQAGDECLRVVARCVESSLRRPADLAARYGGEELVVLLPQTDAAAAHTLAEEIRGKVESLTIDPGGVRDGLRVTLSAGVAGSNPRLSGEDGRSLVRRADEALYRAKASGRNRSMTAPLLDHSSLPNQELEE